MMGDLNAKVGSENVNNESDGKGKMLIQNDNEERLTEWFAFNNMIIGGTIFPHRNIQKLTWTSPNGQDQNQIDHLMVNSMWRHFLLDVKVSSILQPLFDTIWNRQKIPDDWSQGTIIRIPKKGALSECSNLRGITLLSIPSKILAKVIMKRQSLAVDPKLRAEKAGSRRGRG